MLFSACDEHAKVVLKVDSVDMDDTVHLIHHIGHGPHLPEPLVAASERTTAARHRAMHILR